MPFILPLYTHQIVRAPVPVSSLGTCTLAHRTWLMLGIFGTSLEVSTPVFFLTTSECTAVTVA